MESLVVVLAVAIAGIVLLALLNLIGRNQPGLDRAYYMDAWQKLHIKAQAEETWALAVIEADKLLDHALKKKGYAGQTMAERMVSAKDILSKRQLVWEAHKFRNQIVHEEVKVTEKKVHASLVGFRSALKDLGAL
jgi:tRNA A37 N6-isopentenylltransferase MiaA